MKAKRRLNKKAIRKKTFRKLFAKRMILLFFLFLFAWVLADMGTTLIPFGVSFLLAYLIDPLVEKLQKNGAIPVQYQNIKYKVNKIYM